jgi:hypothetical protein
VEGKPAWETRRGASGTAYQVQTRAYWDAGPQGNIRVVVSIDDGGWRFGWPMNDSFILSPQESFVGE